MKNDASGIVVLTTDFKPMTGGVAEYLHNLWDHVARFQAVTVMTPVKPGETTWNRSYQLNILPPMPERRLKERLGDHFVPLRKFNTARYFLNLRRHAKRTVDMVREMGDGKIHVFIGIWGTESHFWCEELRRAAIPYSLHAYGRELILPLYGRLPQWRKMDFTNAREILAISVGTAGIAWNSFGPNPPAHIVTPGAGPPPDRAIQTKKTDELKNEFGLSGRNILLTVARLVPRKGIDLVLQSVADLAAKHGELYYLIAGDGPEKNRLQSLAKSLGVQDRVSFLGQVDETTKWALYDLCDLFVMPNRLMEGSDWEGFGIVFLEAALFGKAAIGGGNGGVPDAIKDGVTGLLIDPEKRGDLTGALDRLLSDQKLLQQMGEAARKRTENGFNWPAIAARFREQQGWLG